MRGRRRERGAAGNLDSLLDTMTNVVGILVIVLVMTQVNFADAIRRLRADLPEISVKQMDALSAEAGQVEEEIALLRSPDGEFDAARAAETEARVGVLKVDIEKELERAAPREELVQLVATKASEVEEARRAKQSAESRLAGLRTELESARALAGRPPVRVRLPNPRPAREDSSEVLLACLGERVYVIDVAELQAIARKSLESAGRGVMHRVEGSGDNKRTIYKRKESEAHIGEGKTGNAMATFTLRTFPDRPWGQLIITPRPKGGQPVSEIRDSARGAIRQRMQRAFLDRDYLYFLVAPDAFATYLEARRIAEVDHNLPVGWEFVGQDLRLYKGASGLRFEHTPPPPPPPDPNPKPPAPTPPKPKPPPVLD